MGDLEISVLHKIYNSVLFLFEMNYNNELHLLQINGDNNNSIILTLCFINNNHYNIIYENINSSISQNINLTNKTLNELLINKIVNNNLKTLDKTNINIIYANDTRKIKYIDILNYLKSKKFKNHGIYPSYIYDLDNKRFRKQKKKIFEDPLQIII